MLVSVLLILVFLGIAQVALLIHARDVLVADAAEGARAAALRDASLGAGERDCAALIAQSLSSLVTAGQKPCTASYEPGTPQLVRMRAQGTVPLTLVPFGHVRLAVSARAMVEPAS